jgi:hypothetical protein
MAKAGDGTSNPIEAVDTFGVLAGEYELIWPNTAKPKGLKDYYRRVQQNKQAALCLSGGGIRSASFALGVLQALSKKRLLTSFHYLSTVSGGGYIGGWLQRWIYENGDATAVMDELSASCRARVDGSAEAGDAEDTSGVPYEPVEPRQIRSLRENSNFLTPRVGISSNDTWTAISISVRNIAVNWLLFAPLFLLVTMVPNFFNNWVGWVGIAAARTPALVYIPLGLSLVCAAVAAWHTCRALPSYRAVEFDVAGAGDGWLLKRIVKWLIGWAMFGTMVLWADVQVLAVKAAGGSAKVGAAQQAAVQPAAQSEGWGAWLTSNLTSSLGFAVVSVLVALLSLSLSGRMLPKDGRHPDRDYRGAFFDDFGIWVAAFAAAAITIPVGSLIFSSLSPSLSPEWALRLFATLGPLWLMGSQLMIAFVFAAFRRNSGGTVNADADREWLARLSAVKIKQMLLWGVLAFTTLLLVHLLAVRLSGFSLSLTSLVALVSGVTAVFGGRGESTGNTTGGAAASILRFLPVSAIISLATFVFVIALLTIFGAIEQLMAARIGRFLDPGIIASGQYINLHFSWNLAEKWLDSQVLAHIVIAVVLGILLYRLDKRIPVNRFSLNGLYRNRLSRAFLGGARLKRNPDPFTGFDPDDNVNVSDLKPSYGGAAVLYPVVNVALNVTATKNLAWQERKAAPFILSPLYSGSDILVREGETPDKSPPGAYIRSSCYAGSEPGQQGPRTGISLATAISISGAAASPNMGYHSSAATAFLMTLFNVRLGAWLPNPAKAKTLGDNVCLSSPSSSLRALLRELGGSTDDQGKEIYLSDGGHFENLALYEMIRRRCPFIVVSDAGADPNCDFSDLGSAVRKVKIDLGADIIFTKMRISSRARPIDPQFAWALGDVCYGDGQSGKILYIKPSFYDHDLPVDVVSYAKASETFPHESTGDQFFSESQFESYRKLGFTFADEIGKRKDGGVDYDSVEAFFEAIAKLEGDYEGQEETGLKTGLRRWLGL